jgi:hypothetical protein
LGNTPRTLDTENRYSRKEFPAADLGLARKPVRRPFDEGMTVAPLHESAAEIYSRIPGELFYPSFSTVEYWERLARQVLFDTSDFFQQRILKEEIKLAAGKPS